MTIDRQLVLTLGLIAGALGLGFVLSTQATQADPVSPPAVAAEPAAAAVAIATEAEPAGGLFHLDPLDVHPRTSLTVVEQLRTNHYLPKGLDDDASSALSLIHI